MIPVNSSIFSGSLSIGGRIYSLIGRCVFIEYKNQDELFEKNSSASQ